MAAILKSFRNQERSPSPVVVGYQSYFKPEGHCLNSGVLRRQRQRRRRRGQRRPTFVQPGIRNRRKPEPGATVQCLLRRHFYTPRVS